jgi:hypothetical protein
LPGVHSLVERGIILLVGFALLLLLLCFLCFLPLPLPILSVPGFGSNPCPSCINGRIALIGALRVSLIGTLRVSLRRIGVLRVHWRRIGTLRVSLIGTLIALRRILRRIP